ncbi:MAG: copper homeostasis protein CutC [Bacteroidia bacterium]
MVKPLLEIACFKAEDVLPAVTAGADRIEYCADYRLGGLTPALPGFEAIRNATNIPIYVMIRCRGGNFVYSNAELRQMAQQLQEFKSAGADGFVFGALLPHHRVDLFAIEKLAHAAGPLPWTFHRAFDLIDDAITTLDLLPDFGCRQVLSSGGAQTAILGQSKLYDLAAHAAHRLRILAGGGIRSHNLNALLGNNCPFDIHSAALNLQGVIALDEIAQLAARIKKSHTGAQS